MTVEAPPKYELMYSGREELLAAEDGKDFEGFRPLEGTYKEVSDRAIELNEQQLKRPKGRITRLFFPELKREPADE